MIGGIGRHGVGRRTQPTQTTMQLSQAEHRETTTEQEEEPRQESLRPKRRCLGRGLVKDTTTVTGTVAETDAVE